MALMVLGGGQLARMLAMEAKKLNIDVLFLVEPGVATSPVEGLGKILVRQADLSIAEQLKDLPEISVMTAESENIQSSLLDELSSTHTVRPCPPAIVACQNRGNERRLLDSLGIPTSPHQVVENYQELEGAVSQLGLPLVLKTLTEGYDGKGQWVADDAAEFAALDADSLKFPLLVEQKIAFNREVSLIGVRSAAGKIDFYPVAENIHKNGILVASLAPAENVRDFIQEKATDYLTKIMEHLDYVGVMAMECFETDDQLLVNELAPRVHNSGHWSLDSNVTNQFENHVRAVTDLELGNTQTNSTTLMLNILGEIPEALHANPAGFQLHDYQKSARPGRKVGHTSAVYSGSQELVSKLKQLQASWDNPIIELLIQRYEA